MRLTAFVGAAMAIEDAAMLTHLLSPGLLPSSDSILNAAKIYEERRSARRAGVLDLSMKEIELTHLEDGLRQSKRDELASLTQNLSGIARRAEEDMSYNKDDMPLWADAKQQQWLYGYDVMNEA